MTGPFRRLGKAFDMANVWPKAPTANVPGFTLEEHKNLMGETSLATDRTFFRSAWALMKPYWLTSKGLKGWMFLASSIGLSVTNVYLSTINAGMNQQFIDNVVKAGTTTAPDAVRAAAQTEAWHTFGQWVGLVIPAMIFTSVYYSYLQSKLNLHWREAMTKDMVKDWLGDKTYHRLRTIYNKMDNPEQRLEQDINLFTGQLVDIPLGLLHAGMTLAAFSAVLWNISDQINFKLGGWEFTSDLHLNIAEKSVGAPGYLFLGALVYAVFGTGMVHKIGKKLIDLDRKQESVNAEFRASMARIRENSETIAFFGGEEQEEKRLRAKFRPIAENWDKTIKRNKKLGWFKSYYNEAADLFPFVIAAPAVMSGAISYGQLIQARIAFSRVDYGLTWFVSSYNFLASVIATTQRLTSFKNAMDQSKVDYARTNIIEDKPASPAPVIPPAGP